MKTGFELGAKLSIKLERFAEENPEFVLASSFEGENGSGAFLIAAPFYGGTYFPLKNGELCEIKHISRTAIFLLMAEAGPRIRKDALLFNKMKQVSEVIRIQRRDHFRVEHSTRVSIVSKNPEYGDKPLRAAMVDLSAGGTMCRMDEQLTEGEIVDIEFNLESVGRMNAKAEVRWVRPINNSHIGWSWELGLKFISNMRTTHDMLGKFIHWKQIQSRSRRSR